MLRLDSVSFLCVLWDWSCAWSWKDRWDTGSEALCHTRCAYGALSSLGVCRTCRKPCNRTPLLVFVLYLGAQSLETKWSVRYILQYLSKVKWIDLYKIFYLETHCSILYKSAQALTMWVWFINTTDL